MSGLNARLEGFAREQLSQGKGTMSIVHELVRMGHIDKGAAQAIVENATPAVRAQSRRPGRRSFWFGLFLLAVPAMIVTPFVFDVVVLYGGTSLLWPRLRDALMPLVAAPVLVWEIVGFAFAASGWSAMRRSKNSIHPSGPSGPLSTGLWWRAEPFEWK